jgi:hypothetical protein
MNISTTRLREIIEEEVNNLAEEDYEEVDVEEFEQPDPDELRAQMPVEDLARVVMKLVETHPEGMEVLKQALIELYDVEVEEYEEEEMDPNVPVGPEAPPVVQRIGFEESLDHYIAEEIAAVLKEYTEKDAIGHAQQSLSLELTFEDWVEQVKGFGFEFGEDSPNPYDAWLQGATPHDYAQSGGIEISEVHSDKQRRWACAQADKPASERKDGLSKAEAEEMCSGPMK